MSGHAEEGIVAPGDSHGHLAHHFEQGPEQQYSASKLGMWLFLATELLMFGGLFTAYAIYRGNHPELFRWGHVFLDRKLGAINTFVLITSSLTMALAVRSAQQGERRRLVLFLFLTLLGALGFLGIKYTEYRPKIDHGLLWGTHFAPDPVYVAHHFGLEVPAHAGKPAEPKEAPVDLDRGHRIVVETCASCHGKDLHGLPNSGVNLIESEFVGARSDAELLSFLKVGRQPFDPESRTKVQMPPRGGNPTLTDEKLRDVVAYLRTVWVGPGAATTATAVGSATAASLESVPLAEEDIPRSVLPMGAPAPEGLAVTKAPATPAEVPVPPKNAQHFFGIYFLMTGLHAIHVIAGMVVILWLLVGAIRGRFGPDYFTPVDLGGLFWHLVDLIWIFLFPLFYLI